MIIKITDDSSVIFLHICSKNKSQRKSKKLLTFTDLYAIITTEGQRKSKTNLKNLTLTYEKEVIGK